MSWAFWGGHLGYSGARLYSIDATCFERRSVVGKALLIPLIAKREELVKHYRKEVGNRRSRTNKCAALRTDITLAGNKPEETAEV